MTSKIASTPAEKRGAETASPPRAEASGGEANGCGPPTRNALVRGPDQIAPSRWRTVLRGGSACLFSTAFHLIVLVCLALMLIPERIEKQVRTMVASVLTERLDDPLLKIELEENLEAAVEITQAVFSSSPEVGAAGSLAAGIAPPALDRRVVEQFDAPKIDIGSPTLSLPPAERVIVSVPDGTLGDPRAIVDNYQEALDRITAEIMWMLDRGDVLLIWCFDQSESMKDDQEEIRSRIDRVYSELGLTGSSGEHLTTAVTSYGSSFQIHTPRPTSDQEEIRKAIASVPVDPSGKEMMCLAVTRSIAQYRSYVAGGRRQMAFVLVTDESGDRENNDRFLEQTVAEARAADCRVYVLGREAVFGYPYAHMRWQHPQTLHVHWLPVDRGPETAFVEQLQTDGFRRRYDAFSSGFGPFEQTRLARETGGIFFMLPTVEATVVRAEKRRYELEAMHAYQPDLRAKVAVVADRDNYPLRELLWKVIYDLNPYNERSAQVIEMRLQFSPRPDEFLRQVRHEQDKAKLFIRYLSEAQKLMESDAARQLRQQETSPRWQANYDLIHAQLIAYQARLYEYGVALEKFVKNPRIVPLRKPPDLTLAHWDVDTGQETLAGEVSQPYIDRAAELFQEVIRNHPGTPWAARAEAELRRGFGIILREDYDRPRPTVTGPLDPIPKL